MKFLAKGAEASIYLTVHEGKPAVLKRRSPKPYRDARLDEKIRRERTRREARTMAAVKRMGVRAPLVYSANEGKAEIVMQKIGGRLLKDVPAAGMAAFVECGRELALMHAQGVVHGDFTSANVIMEKGGAIVFIDFGLASFSQSVEEQATDLVVFAKSVSERQYEAFLKGYCKASGSKAKAIVRQVGQIGSRGRYAVRAQAND